MRLRLGDHWKGQFFTPYHISDFIASVAIGDSAKEIEEKGRVSIYDPCIGAGGMLIAAADTFRKRGVNYQRDVLFVGQDIDRIVAMMAYVQLSLLGCPGYIYVGNSLAQPVSNELLFPTDIKDQELWVMPMLMSDIWRIRRQTVLLSRVLSLYQRKESGIVFFFFNEN